PLARVLLHLPVELLLHGFGMTDVVERRLPVATRGLDLEIARADDALPDLLMEVDVVHALERDLDPALREHPGAEDHAVARHDEVGEIPAEVLQPEPDGPDEHGNAPDPTQHPAHVAVEGLDEEEHDDQ